MNRAKPLKSLLMTSAVVFGSVGCLGLLSSLAGDDPVQNAATGGSATEETASDSPFAIPEYEPCTKAQLRRGLSSIQYTVTQQDGTEPAFRNLYWDNKKEGLYRCVVCQYPLFTSQTKYKSGTGWPSFYAPIGDKSVATKRDWKMLYPRTEVHCSRCEAHLGHVFDDGPQPTGKRYCMNSASLKFEEMELPTGNPVQIPAAK